jgi:hypothetical protein
MSSGTILFCAQVRGLKRRPIAKLKTAIIHTAGAKPPVCTQLQSTTNETTTIRHTDQLTTHYMI